MNTYALKAAGFFLPSGFVEGGYLLVDRGIIGGWQETQPSDVAVCDCADLWVAPGLVDIHMHGIAGEDVMDLSPSGLDTMCQALPAMGVTSWFPTTLTAPEKEIEQACRMVGEHVNAPRQAKVEGIFLEGPWFSPQKKGAQNEQYMSDPDRAAFDTWIEALQGRQMKIALAPERKGSAEFCAYAERLGAVVCIGHTNATYEEAARCIDAGASVMVHTYNCMSGMNHRSPGVVGAALTCPGIFAEVICDGEHVALPAIKLLFEAVGPERACLITDAIRATGLPDGMYKLGELDVVVKGNTARLVEGNNLAGSILTLKQAVKNVVSWGLATPEKAIAMASHNPAKAAHIDDYAGSLTRGHVADITVFDQKMNLCKTFVAGELAYDASASDGEVVLSATGATGAKGVPGATGATDASGTADTLGT